MSKVGSCIERMIWSSRTKVPHLSSLMVGSFGSQEGGEFLCSIIHRNGRRPIRGALGGADKDKARTRQVDMT